MKLYGHRTTSAEVHPQWINFRPKLPRASLGCAGEVGHAVHHIFSFASCPLGGQLPELTREQRGGLTKMNRLGSTSLTHFKGGARGLAVLRWGARGPSNLRLGHVCHFLTHMSDDQVLLVEPDVTHLVGYIPGQHPEGGCCLALIDRFDPDMMHSVHHVVAEGNDTRSWRTGRRLREQLWIQHSCGECCPGDSRGTKSSSTQMWST